MPTGPQPDNRSRRTVTIPPVDPDRVRADADVEFLTRCIAFALVLVGFGLAVWGLR
jgi:hypothetical protein